MGCKPEWSDSTKEESAAVWRLRFNNIIHLVDASERLTFLRDDDTGDIVGEYFTKKGGYGYVTAATLEEVIILLQEKLL